MGGNLLLSKSDLISKRDVKEQRRPVCCYVGGNISFPDGIYSMIAAEATFSAHSPIDFICEMNISC